MFDTFLLQYLTKNENTFIIYKAKQSTKSKILILDCFTDITTLARTQEVL